MKTTTRLLILINIVFFALVNIAKGQTINLDKGVCIQVITYAQNPVTLNWVIFSTPCDVPTGWLISYEKPKEFKQPIEE